MFQVFPFARPPLVMDFLQVRETSQGDCFTFSCINQCWCVVGRSQIKLIAAKQLNWVREFMLGNNYFEAKTISSNEWAA